MADKKVLHKDYLGIKNKIKPDQLDHFEEAGGFVLEEKYNGWWCAFTVGWGTKGETRWCNDILDIPTVRIYSATVAHVIGEWMKEEGKLWLYDVVKIGSRDVKSYPLKERRVLLEDVYSDIHNHEDILLAPQYTCSFRTVYNDIVENGGEGVVIKHKEARYYARNSARKSGLYFKCKPQYEDNHAKTKTNFEVSVNPDTGSLVFD